MRRFLPKQLRKTLNSLRCLDRRFLGGGPARLDTWRDGRATDLRREAESADGPRRTVLGLHRRVPSITVKRKRGVGGSSRSRYQSYDYPRQTTVFCDSVRSMVAGLAYLGGSGMHIDQVTTP